MRKILLFSLMAVMLVPAVLGQMTATIGDTSCLTETNYLPWYHYWWYSEAQYGIPASELAALGNAPATITKIGWYSCENPPSADFSLNVYIDQVPGTYDLSLLAGNPYGNTNEVAANKSSFTVSGNIHSLTLDTPIVYTPGNVLIITVCDTADYCGSYNHNWAANYYYGNGFTRYSDSVSYDCNMLTNDGGNSNTSNVWSTTWFEFTSSAASYNLTMFAPGGTGTGTVQPTPGVHSYLDGALVNITATPTGTSLFDYWELDGAFYSNDENESVLMNANHTVQAFFKPFSALALPFYEDFTGVATGAIPANWDTNYTNWGASSSSMAGGTAPEMEFSWSPSVTDANRLITPKLDATSVSNVMLTFKHYVNDYNGDYMLRVQTSTDEGSTWQDRWSEPGGPLSGEVMVSLNAVAGQEFQLAFVFDGDSYNINYWYIDDIYVGVPPTMWELDMLNPVGQGGVIPGVGLHDMIVDGTEITLAAIPSSTWYAFDIFEDFSFAFDPMTPGISNFIADMPTADFISALPAPGRMEIGMSRILPIHRICILSIRQPVI